MCSVRAAMRSSRILRSAFSRSFVASWLQGSTSPAFWVANRSLAAAACCSRFFKASCSASSACMRASPSSRCLPSDMVSLPPDPSLRAPTTPRVSPPLITAPRSKVTWSSGCVVGLCMFSLAVASDAGTGESAGATASCSSKALPSLAATCGFAAVVSKALEMLSTSTKISKGAPLGTSRTSLPISPNANDAGTTSLRFAPARILFTPCARPCIMYGFGLPRMIVRASFSVAFE
mmetsp:Transcript_1199/g.2488  ORF Transcript_1199/g.2488 Transcript_1199/m.2488 type:complete len:234 (-) Transcript_1199:369-1070(-)